AEIQELALNSLALAGMRTIRLDLCHVGVLRAIIANDAGAKRDEAQLFGLLQANDVPGLKEITASYQEGTRAALLAL
ncbi:ATP phosphoribosyltransferase regulatory subunit, partial [Acinetobacter baumannii]